MIAIRRRAEIYHKDGGWFSSYWHFSFDEYYDPENLGFGPLRVFNDDILIPGAVWPMHPHENVEAITYVVQGEFEHRDSLGNDGVLRAGSVQRMTLGSGAQHSEANHSQTEPVRFIQMWILPSEMGLKPSVEQKTLSDESRLNRLLPIVTPKGVGTVSVHQDANVYVSRLESGTALGHEIAPGYGVYFCLLLGSARLNGEELRAGDAARIIDELRLMIEAQEPAELIMVEVRP